MAGDFDLTNGADHGPSKQTPSEVVSSSSCPPSNKLQEQFDIVGKVYVVTGGGRGLGLAMAEALIEAGAHVYCLDQLTEPHPDLFKAQQASKELAIDGMSTACTLHYRCADVRDSASLDASIEYIVAQHGRLDGLVAAAAVQQITPAFDYSVSDICKMVDVNYTGTFLSARAVAKKMSELGCHGSIVLVASMSGLVANKGLLSPVYNSTKAAVIQLSRNLAMEWSKYGIRVNALCPGHIITPMVEQNFKDQPELKGQWERESMLGRLAVPAEFKGCTLFLCSQASSYMTGASLVIDGGHTAW